MLDSLLVYIRPTGCVIYWPDCFRFSSLSPLCTARGRVQHMDWQDWWRVWEFYILNNWISCPLYRKLYKIKRITDTGRVRQTIATLANVSQQLFCFSYAVVVVGEGRHLVPRSITVLVKTCHMYMYPLPAPLLDGRGVGRFYFLALFVHVVAVLREDLIRLWWLILFGRSTVCLWDALFHVGSFVWTVCGTRSSQPAALLRWWKPIRQRGKLIDDLSQTKSLVALVKISVMQNESLRKKRS